MYTSIIAAVREVGFPAALAAFLVWFLTRQVSEHLNRVQSQVDKIGEHVTTQLIAQTVILSQIVDRMQYSGRGPAWPAARPGEVAAALADAPLKEEETPPA